MLQKPSGVKEDGCANFKTRIVKAIAIIASPNVSKRCFSILLFLFWISVIIFRVLDRAKF